MKSLPLKKVLLSNAAFSALTGLILIVDHQSIALLMGAHPAWIYLTLGVGLCIFALDVGFVATRNKINKTWAKMILAADISWVAGSAALIAFGQSFLSNQANILILVIGLLVAIFSFLEYQFIVNNDNTVEAYVA